MSLAKVLSVSLSVFLPLSLSFTLSNTLFGGIRIIRRENKQDLEIRGDRRKHTARQTLAAFTHAASSGQCSSRFPGTGREGCDESEVIF